MSGTWPRTPRGSEHKQEDFGDPQASSTEMDNTQFSLKTVLLKRAWACLRLTGDKTPHHLPFRMTTGRNRRMDIRMTICAVFLQFYLACESFQNSLLTLFPPTCSSSNQEDIFLSMVGLYFLSKLKPPWKCFPFKSSVKTKAFQEKLTSTSLRSGGFCFFFKEKHWVEKLTASSRSWHSAVM